MYTLSVTLQTHMCWGLQIGFKKAERERERERERNEEESDIVILDFPFLY